jgi:hypothetical protein
MIRKVSLGLALALAFLASPAFAQIVTQDNALRTNITTFWYGPVGGATSCNTVSTTAANAEVSIPALAGQYINITHFHGKKSTDATGITETLTVSVSNVLGAPFIDFNSALTTVQGSPPSVDIAFNPPLKTTAPGLGVIFLPSATESAHSYLCMDVAGYYSNQ